MARNHEHAAPSAQAVCGQCGYDLRGLATVRSRVVCPECGRDAVPVRPEFTISLCTAGVVVAAVLSIWAPVWYVGLNHWERVGAGGFQVIALAGAATSVLVAAAVGFAGAPGPNRSRACVQTAALAGLLDVPLVLVAFVLAAMIGGANC